MPIPSFDQFIEPVLRFLHAHPVGATIRDVYEAAADSLLVPESE